MNRDAYHNQAVDVSTHRYSGYELVGALPHAIRRSDLYYQADTGDILLHQGSNLVIMLGSNSWDYTKLGTIRSESLSQLTTLSDYSTVTVTLSSHN